MVLRDLLYADNSDLIANSEEDAQSSIDDFARATVCYGLTISIKKMEVLHQLRPGTPPAIQSPLLCYLGGTISQNAKIVDQIVAQISEACASFGCLQHCLSLECG